jgi:hypothetical protein
MQQVPTENLDQAFQSNLPRSSSPSSQHGSYQFHPSGLSSLLQDGSSCSSPRSVPGSHISFLDGVDAQQLDERLRRLSISGKSSASQPTAGQRIRDYENALIPSAPRQALGFRVIKRSDSASGGVQLNDFPNGWLLCL